MPRVHINIGTNLGDRHENIGRAVEHLRQLAHSLPIPPSTPSTNPSTSSDFSDFSDLSELSEHSEPSEFSEIPPVKPSLPLDPDFRVSSIIESEPWGFTSENRFLNVGVSFNTKLSPRSLLDTLLTIQRTLSDAPHRGLCGGYIDRLIDLDLIFYGTQTIGYPSQPPFPIPPSTPSELSEPLPPVKPVKPIKPAHSAPSPGPVLPSESSESSEFSDLSEFSEIPPVKPIQPLQPIQSVPRPIPGLPSESSASSLITPCESALFPDLTPASVAPGDLLVPHPRMHLREFVLRPMIEIDPDWRHPILHLTPSQLLDLLPHH